MSAVFKKDGKYLRYHESTTHTGTHRTAEWVDDLQRATVFHSSPPYRLWQDELKDAEKLEATETRTVTLTPNVELTGAAAGLLPQRPATEGSEVERRVWGVAP